MFSFFFHHSTGGEGEESVSEQHTTCVAKPPLNGKTMLCWSSRYNGIIPIIPSTLDTYFVTRCEYFDSCIFARKTAATELTLTRQHWSNAPQGLKERIPLKALTVHQYRYKWRYCWLPLYPLMTKVTDDGIWVRKTWFMLTIYLGSRLRYSFCLALYAHGNILTSPFACLFRVAAAYSRCSQEQFPPRGTAAVVYSKPAYCSHSHAC